MRLRPVDRASQQRTRLSSNLFLRERKTKEDERERKRERERGQSMCVTKRRILCMCVGMCVWERARETC